MNVSARETLPEEETFGQRLKAKRKARNLTLTELATRSSVSASTISKVENGGVSPTYDVILKLAAGLSIPVSAMFGETISESNEGPRPTGWQVVGRPDEYDLLDTKNYEHRYLCSSLKTKRLLPVLVRIKAGSIAEFGELVRHDGEEFIYVLRGTVELHSEFYATVVLNVGEYAYLDSTMGHAYVSGSKEDAEILCICAGQVSLESDEKTVI
ncbi:XRE family transcriptional regulator [Primorskyibacter aestuariivivens]|uniref:helix-turn-helix domain-containing protein n=1 Tax=Primorskyibacter aestuariivivens TaxID=1888912 RepID=UPI002300AD7B|nr:XRE family transcriptional regulator [Primorskyibacter aestuariivivens]MDA7430092.1 XRE family transcriptional regulator [Primorskyibacter aestuariivivens]